MALLLRVGFPAVAVKQRHHLTSDDLKADVHKVINTGIIIISVFAEPSRYFLVGPGSDPMLLKSLWLPSVGSSQKIIIYKNCSERPCCLRRVLFFVLF